MESREVEGGGGRWSEAKSREVERGGVRWSEVE